MRAREAEARGGASREDLASRLEAAEARRLALKEEAGRLAAGLRRHLEAKTGGLGVGPYLRRLKEEVERLKGLAAEDARLREEAGALRAELSALRARKEEQAKALAEAEAATRGLMPEAEAQGLALSPEEQKALRAELEAFRKDLAEAEAAWKSLPPLSGPAPTLEEAQGRVEALRKALAELEGRLEEKRKEEGALEDRVERLRKDLARRREVEGALARLVAELSLWEKLALDLQAHNFPAYLLGLKQRSLVERASELLYTLSGGGTALRPRGTNTWWWTSGPRPPPARSGPSRAGRAFSRASPWPLPSRKSFPGQAGGPLPGRGLRHPGPRGPGAGGGHPGKPPHPGAARGRGDPRGGFGRALPRPA
nr:hypothetical protein [Thermus parvatiensis]